MYSPRIKVLGIAPYQAMKTSMEKIVLNYPQIDLDVYVGDMNEGVSIVQSHQQLNYDVIISRGGTAELIRSITCLPVIEINLTVYDILRAMKLAENYTSQYAIVGFPNITNNAHLLCDLLQYNLNIVNIHKESEVEAILRKLKADGCSMIVCDMIANTTAKKMGLNSILITSGSESIEYAFEQAIKLCANSSSLKEMNTLFKELLQQQDTDLIVFDIEKNICFSTINHYSEEFSSALKKEIPNVMASKKHKFFRNINEHLYSITSKVFDQSSKCYVAFYITSDKIPLSTGKYGIYFSSLIDIEEEFYNNFYNIENSKEEPQKYIENISQSTLPIIILGESATGKELLAKTLYSKSTQKNNPFITIDCSLLCDKGWNFLMNHYNSPLNDNNNTILFKNMETLTHERFQILLSTITDTNLTTRNKIIFSCISCGQDSNPHTIHYLLNTLSCLIINTLPLRECKEEIGAYASLYLGNLNVEQSKQVIGFEPKAMELMQNYEWPGNQTQFKRVINELFIITSSSYISAEDVISVLEQEKQIHSKNNITNSDNNIFTEIDFNRTLDEISQDIVQLCLSQNKNNQSLTAKQLGISRSTLWRYLNRS